MVYEKVYREESSSDGKKKLITRMVRWNSQRPYVEKRELLFDTRRGGWSVGKCRGFTAADLDFLMDLREQLAQDFKHAEACSFNPAAKTRREALASR